MSAYDISDGLEPDEIEHYENTDGDGTVSVEITGGNDLPVYDADVPVDIDSELNENDLPTCIIAEIRRKGIAGDHINSMNTFYRTGLKQIITKLFKPEVHNMKNERDKDSSSDEDKNIEYISFTVEFTGCELKAPTTMKYSSRHQETLTPNMARLRNLNYSAPLYVAAKISTTATYKNGKTETREEIIKLEDKWKIASIPVMVKSELCHLWNASENTAKMLEEDPKDPGGYFIIKGTEWVVDKSENLVLNLMHGYLNRYGKEIARATFQSKPGDAYENSYYLVVKYLTDNQIIVQIVTNKYAMLEIPFYLIFRAFGMTSDADIVNNIVYGVENTDSVTKYMLDVLERAFKAPNKDFANVLESRESNVVMSELAAKMFEIAANPKLNKDPNAVKYVYNRTVSQLDKFIFPHIGGGVGSRITKLKFMGHLIHKLLRIVMGVLPGTDRDSYRNKRVHAAGVALAKTFKTQFNFAIVQEIKKHLVKDFKNTRWSKVQLAESVKSSINANDLERAMIQSIITGEKTLTIKRNEVANRVSSQQLYHKNDMNVYATLNNISTHGQSAAKATDRATDMRMAHNTYYGYIGMAQSADTGEKVGMNKQMGSTASVTEASSSYILKEYVLRNPAILRLDKVDPAEINSRQLTKIFINGDWIGLCEDSEQLVRYYRTARRYGHINPFTTIVWELLVREVYFWVDVGRLVRPLVIVYNNNDEFVAEAKRGRKIEFKQWITLTKKHIRELQSGKITMDNLREQRVIEYISPEESENMLIARSLTVLRESIADFTKQYTHMGIEQDVFGIVELSAPNTNHTPASRITMFTNHKKQTCGWYTLNWPFRIDKNTFLQYYCEVPIVRAFSNAFSYPNAQNVILAYMTSKGFGQEDSLEINKSSIDLGLFTGSHFYYEKTELESDESFGNPDYARTLDFKKDAVYEHVDENGFIREGTEVHKGYVLIVKRAKLSTPTENFLYVDRSVIYKSDEPAIVERVIYPRNDEDVLVAKVKLRSSRPLRVGDKLSSHSGCKGINALMVNRADLPYCEDGLVPDIIINPHSFPTRMVIGQVIETMMGELAVRMGCLFDGTPFRHIDINGIIKTLAERYNIQYGGHKRMFNGKTGNWYDAMIFIGPTSYQRLQKFVADENYAMSTGPTESLTRQPTDGKTRNGGLRIGEMEKDTLVSHGVMRTLYSKFYQDSDGIEIYICRLCGSRAIINERAGLYKCKNCKDNADIASVPSSWVANLFLNEINAMGVKTTFELEPFTRT